MNWILLFLAGLFEVSLAFCLGKTKVTTGTEFYLWGTGFLLSTVLSMYLLAKAIQTLPIGTAYAVWTGIGAVGTVIIGILFFKEPATPKLHPKSWTQNFWGALCIDTTTLKND